MNESTLYYTFSTVPQTLAGGGAILVAVVLYRLGEIDRIIDTAPDPPETAWQAYPFRGVWRALQRNGGKGGERVPRRRGAGAGGGGGGEEGGRPRAGRGQRGGGRD